MNYHGYFADFDAPVFITGDNPVVLMGTPLQGTPEWFIAPLSPQRCIYVVSQPQMPSEPGFYGLKPNTVNQMVLNASTEYCLSFDRSLHLP